MSQTGNQSRHTSARIAYIAIFSAFAGVLYALGFALPFAFPGFLELKLSDVPTLIGAFALGPSAGAAIAVVEILLKLVIKGSSTMLVGELSDLATSCAFAVVAGIVYKRHRTIGGAFAAIGSGAVCEIVVAIISNRVVLVPFYVEVFFGGRWEPLIAMMTPIFPSCTRETFYSLYLWASVLPFNALRCTVAAVITLLIYKRVSRLINAVNIKLYGKPDRDATREKRIDVAMIATALALVALLIAFALLRVFVFK